MANRITRLLTGLGIGSLVLAGITPAAAYRVPDGFIELLPERSQASGINNLGHVVGDRFEGTTRRGFLVRDGVVTDLGAFSPSDINDRGQIVGCIPVGEFACTDGLLWENGQVTNLGSFRPRKINAAGQMIGSGTFRDADGSFTSIAVGSTRDLDDFGNVLLSAQEGPDDFEIRHSYVWRDGVIVTDLGVNFDAWVMNNRGLIAGCRRDCFAGHGGLLWKQGRFVDTWRRAQLGVDADWYLTPTAMSERGEVIGTVRAFMDGDLGFYTAVWANRHIHRLPDKGGSSMGSDINDEGQAVGTAYPGSSCCISAVLWK